MGPHPTDVSACSICSGVDKLTIRPSVASSQTRRSRRLRSAGASRNAGDHDSAGSPRAPASARYVSSRQPRPASRLPAQVRRRGQVRAGDELRRGQAGLQPQGPKVGHLSLEVDQTAALGMSRTAARALARKSGRGSEVPSSQRETRSPPAAPTSRASSCWVRPAFSRAARNAEGSTPETIAAEHYLHAFVDLRQGPHTQTWPVRTR